MDNALDLITLICSAAAPYHSLSLPRERSGTLVAVIVRRFSNRVEVFIPADAGVFLICTTRGVNTFHRICTITVMLALSLDWTPS